MGTGDILSKNLARNLTQASFVALGQTADREAKTGRGVTSTTHGDRAGATVVLAELAKLK
jgi:hypothetical protein